MYKVCIVDDEPLILDGLIKLINWDELDLEIVAQAENGFEALSILESSKIHILITDIKMPEMNGLELIKQINSKNLNIKVIILSGYDDFEYVKEAAKLGIENYLLKPVDIDELIPTLKNSVDKIEHELYREIERRQGIHILRENILNRWLCGNITEMELLERSVLLGIKTGYGSFAACLVRVIHSNKINGDSSMKDKKLLSYAVQNICDQIVKEAQAGICFQNINGDTVILFTSTEDSLVISQSKSIINQCIASINLYLHTDVFVTVGNTVTKILDLSKSYEQAQLLQGYNLFISANKILFFDELDNNSIGISKEFEYDYHTVAELITSRNTDELHKYIKETFSKFSNMNTVSPARIHNFALEMLFDIVTTVRSIKPNSEAIFEKFKNRFSDIYKIKHIEDIVTWVLEITESLICYLQNDDKKINPTIKKVLNYIEGNFTKDINLKTIAFEFDLNPVYLGQLFKNETGHTFTNYLNILRISKAKELLASTDLKLHEISQSVGFLYTNYFCSVFKKISGISPTEYKR